MDFSDLDQEPVATKPSKNEKRFPCGQCGGTGRYQGMRTRQEKGHCFSCGGKGYFLTDPRKLRARRDRARVNKQEALKAGLELFRTEHPDMFRELSNAHALREGNEFIVSLSDQLFRKGSLSENQIAAWYRGKEKLALITAQREEERKQAQVAVDLTPILEMFATAQASGYKKPMYRAEGLRIKPGKEGALYVMNEDRVEMGSFGPQPGYEGKIVGGVFQGLRKTDAATPGKLALIAEDPRGAAVRYGQRTGTCSCCGRELTKHASIEAGIGPICAAKWGL